MRIKSPLEIPNGHPCLKIEEADRLEDDLLTVLIALGMPPEDHIRLTIRGEFFDPAFADYRIELYGFWPEDRGPNRRDRHPSTPAYTLVNFPSKASGTVFNECYHFWLQRVRRRGETVCELVWHPDVRDYLSFRRNVWLLYAEPAKALLAHVQEADLKASSEVQVIATRRGGARNVKIANQPQEVKQALGKRYVELKESLTNLKREARAAYEHRGEHWRDYILKKYPILENHPDLLEETDPHKVPDDPDASDSEMAPWKIAIEIAARETIPGYLPNGVAPVTLKRGAIFPDND